MYERIAAFSQTWGLIYFIVLFIGVLAYVLWPKNRKRFEDAANIPLREEMEDMDEQKHG